MPQSQQPLFERALADPKSVFKKPQAVLDERTLSTQQKRKILMQWEQDARLIQVAEEEAMTSPEGGQVGNEQPLLDDVRSAIRQIGGPTDDHPGIPTKSGGAA